MVTIYTLYENIKLGIKSKGYNMINTKPNILITIAFIRQISNNSVIRYTISDAKIMKILNPKESKLI